MGVPKFYNEFIRGLDHKGILLRSVPQYVSSFSLDMNGLIHQCAQIVYAYGEHADPQRAELVAKADPLYLEVELHNTLASKLMMLLSNVQPQEILVLAVDGVAPQAKIQQQRQRRYRAALERELKPTVVGRSRLTQPTSTWGGRKSTKSDQDTGRVAFDSNAITPGTDFMIRLDSFIQRWLLTNQPVLPAKVIYSGHLVPGEGEHKIMDLMRSGEITGNGAHVLYGLDADLILLSLISPLRNIFLMREDIRDVVSIDNLAVGLTKDLSVETTLEGGVQHHQLGGQHFDLTKLKDFVLMSFLIGNDFLPHQPSLDSMTQAINTMMTVYKDLNQPLTLADGIDWANFTAFLNLLQQYEPGFLAEAATRDVKYPSRMLQAASQSGQFDYNTFRGAWYQNALGPRVQLQSEALSQVLAPSTDRIVAMCLNYLDGLNWVLRYYVGGTGNVDVSYLYRYHHTPLLGDLSSVLGQLVETEAVQQLTGGIPKEEMVLFSPVHQMLAVLPPRSIHLIPPEVRHLMSASSPIIDLFPTNFIIERDGKNNEWQGTVILPAVDPLRLIAAVNTLTSWTEKRAEVYDMRDNIIMVRPEEVQRARQIEQLIRTVTQDPGRPREGPPPERGRGRGRGQGRGRGRGRGQGQGRGRGGGRGRGQGRGGQQGHPQGGPAHNAWLDPRLYQ